MHVIPRVFARPLRFLCLLALVWSGLSVAEPALARAETAGRILIAFEYRAPTACMDEEQAFSLLHRRSRRVARTSPVLAQQHLRMSVVPDASGYRGVLTVTRAGQRPERRRMTGGSCDEVVEALALTAALSIDPDATVTLGPVEPSGARGDDADGSGEPGGLGEPARTTSDDEDDERRREDAEDDDASSTDDDSSTRAHLQLSVGPVLALARLMDHTMHLGGGILFAVSGPERSTGLPLEARVSVYGMTETASVREPTLRTTFYGARLAYCPLRWGGDHFLLLCPVSQLGLLSAESRGFAEGTSTTRFFATLGLEAWSRARISRHLDLWLSPSLEVPLTRRRFGVAPGPEVLASTSAVAWGIAAGAGWNF